LNERIAGLFPPCIFFALYLQLTSATKWIEERLAKKDTLSILAVEKMFENDYPVPSYLADVSSKQDGWVETPEPDADAKPGALFIYAIDCEMVRALSCICGFVY
jgi:hypothetical protein